MLHRVILIFPTRSLASSFALERDLPGFKVVKLIHLDFQDAKLRRQAQGIESRCVAPNFQAIAKRVILSMSLAKVDLHE